MLAGLEGGERPKFEGIQNAPGMGGAGFPQYFSRIVSSSCTLASPVAACGASSFVGLIAVMIAPYAVALRDAAMRSCRKLSTSDSIQPTD
jgi:hypothetical protein